MFISMFISMFIFSCLFFTAFIPSVQDAIRSLLDPTVLKCTTESFPKKKSCNQSIKFYIDNDVNIDINFDFSVVSSWHKLLVF
jgi:hypothetical protein